MRTTVILAASVALLTSACSVGEAQDSGPSISRNFEAGSFTGLEVAGPFDVNVVTGKAPSVSVQGPQKLVDAMEVVTEGNTLKIRTKRKGWFGGGFHWSSGKAVVTVNAAALDEATIAGSGGITIDKVSGERFEGKVAGSGDLSVAQALVRDLKLSIAGSGGTKVAGQAQKASYEIAGSGDLDAGDLTTVDADISIAGSGSIKARATGTAQANIAGSGDIVITGGAKCTSNKHGSGSIECS